MRCKLREAAPTAAAALAPPALHVHPAPSIVYPAPTLQRSGNRWDSTRRQHAHLSIVPSHAHTLSNST